MQADYQILRTSTGLRIGLARLPESECAAVTIHIPAGSRDDPPGEAGLAHFVEHMIFKGTATRDARRISLETEDAGATLNACTSEEQTDYEARGDAATLPLLVDVLCDMVWHSVFPEEEIQLEHDVIAEEIVMYHENPSDHIGDMLSAALWSPHPLGEPVSGSLASIASITREDLAGFVNRHYFRSDVVISVAGPFAADEVLALFEARLPESKAPEPRLAYAEPAAARPPRFETRDTLQIQLALGWTTFGHHDPRRRALRLLAMILGEGASSRLFQKLREDRGLCYQVSCDTSLLSDTGALEIHAGLDPSSLDEALDCIRIELADLTANGPTDAELARAKRLNASCSRAAMESTSAHASWIGDGILIHGRVIPPAAALAEVEAVTADQIRTIAAEFLTAGRQVRAEIRPE